MIKVKKFKTLMIDRWCKKTLQITIVMGMYWIDHELVIVPVQCTVQQKKSE
jgi:hypothetical protein